MSLLAGLAILVVLSIPLVIAIRRSTELFCVRVEQGRPRFTRGRMPQRLLDEIADIVKRPRVDHGEIRVVIEGGSPRVLTAGIGEGQTQQLRNVVGTYRVAQIRAGGRPR